MDLKHGPPAGWYPHPTMAGTQCYWDGAQWTSALAPMSTPSRGAVVTDATLTIGYIASALLPLVGFVIGVVVLAKGKTGHGVGMMALSGLAFVLVARAVANGYI